MPLPTRPYPPPTLKKRNYSGRCDPREPVWRGAKYGWNDAIGALLGANYGWNDAVGAPRRGNLRIAQGRAKRRPGYCRPSPAFALQGQKRKNQRLQFVHTLHLLYMLLPLQGESTVVDSSPRAPLRSALGYTQVAPEGRTDGIIPHIIKTQHINL